jgi:ribosomal protein S12 methylthiotransferase
MRTKGFRSNKVNIVTLGCSKNLVDSEELLTQLRANNMEAEHESTKDDSGIVVINTCGFVDSAKAESIENILRYADAKERGLVDKVYVTGCLSQRYGADLEKEIPGVDAWFGTSDLARLLKTLKADYKHELVGERLITTPNHYAYLKIAEGCDRPCSFCAIPIMRGKHVSQPEEVLVAMAKSLVAKGVRELILIAQDLTYYGLDLYGKRSLASLLEKLSDVEGVEWIRLQYAYPSGFPTDVLEVMAARPNICKYLDMPLQHGSDNMLRLMRRGITRAKTEALLANIRRAVPGIAIRTTLIVGHPGETEEEFEQLCAFVRWARFDRMGVFTYSHEDQTHSFSMADDIPQEVKEQRQAVLMEIQQQISAELNALKIGRKLKVLIDRKEGGYFVGRTEFDSPEVDNEVLIPAENRYLRRGDFVQVRVVSASEFDLVAEPVAQ